MVKDGKIIAVGIGIAALLIILTAGKPPPPPPPGLANLYGKVTDAETGNPVVGALVTLNGMSVYTDSGGNYAFTDLEPRGYSGSASKENYETGYF